MAETAAASSTLESSPSSDMDAPVDFCCRMLGLRLGDATCCALLGDLLAFILPVCAVAHHRAQHGVRARIRTVRVQPHGAFGPSTRWLGWRTPANAAMSIRALEWPLMNWVRYMVSVHIVRLFAGSVFRATPLWTFYIRLNGARLGRGVYINSLAVNDHNLLEVRRPGRDRRQRASVWSYRRARCRQNSGRPPR